MSNNEYKVYYYKNSRTNKTPVRDYLNKLAKKERAKAFRLIVFLAERKGYLEEPQAKYIEKGIRELRIRFSKNMHRIFYFLFIGKKIILLHAFPKHTRKTRVQEIERAKLNLEDFKRNQKGEEYR